jgi:hypothetical protein
MPTQTATTPLAVVLGSDILREIENTFDGLGKLSEAIEDLENKRAAAKADLVQAIAKDLAAAPLNVDSAVARYNAWKTNDKALADKIEVCEKELPPIIKEHEEELKEIHREAVVVYLNTKLQKLETEKASEEQEEERIKREIAKTKKLLHELEKPASATVTKSKKE